MVSYKLGSLYYLNRPYSEYSTVISSVHQKQVQIVQWYFPQSGANKSGFFHLDQYFLISVSPFLIDIDQKLV